MIKELETFMASLAIGLCLGLIGAGGSILTIPVLVYILKTDPVVSGIYSMFIVGTCSFVGSAISFMKNLLDFRAAMFFGVPSVAGVLMARKILFPALPQTLFFIGQFPVYRDISIMICLSAIMFLVSVKMLLKKDTPAVVANGRPSNMILLVLQSLFAGMVTGLLGVGGGFLIVPALLLWLRLPLKTAIGTTLFIIAINSAVAFLASYNSIVIQWPVLIKFAIGAITGIIAGTTLSGKIKTNNLRIMLAWFIITAAVYVLYKQFSNYSKFGILD